MLEALSSDESNFVRLPKNNNINNNNSTIFFKIRKPIHLLSNWIRFQKINFHLWRIDFEVFQGSETSLNIFPPFLQMAIFLENKSHMTSKEWLKILVADLIRALWSFSVAKRCTSCLAQDTFQSAGDCLSWIGQLMLLEKIH